MKNWSLKIAVCLIALSSCTINIHKGCQCYSGNNFIINQISARPQFTDTLKPLPVLDTANITGYGEWGFWKPLGEYLPITIIDTIK